MIGWVQVSHRLPPLGQKVIVKYVLSRFFSDEAREQMGPAIKYDAVRKMEYTDPKSGKRKMKGIFEIEALELYEVISWIYDPAE